MKYFLPLLLLGMIGVMSACQTSTASEEVTASSDAASPIAGGWELVYGEYTSTAGEKNIVEGEPFQLKVFSDKHFAYVGFSQAGQFNSASSGAYRLEGNRYIETHRYGSNPFLEELGFVTIAWEYKIEDDMLIMSGPLSAEDAEGNDVMKTVFAETKMMFEKRRRAQ